MVCVKHKLLIINKQMWRIDVYHVLSSLILAHGNVHEIQKSEINNGDSTV
jgi:hypothetical protein